MASQATIVNFKKVELYNFIYTCHRLPRIHCSALVRKDAPSRLNWHNAVPFANHLINVVFEQLLVYM